MKTHNQFCGDYFCKNFILAVEEFDFFIWFGSFCIFVLSRYLACKR